MNEIFITGDCHGDFSRFINFCNVFNNNDLNDLTQLSKKDVMICLGDMGLNYYLNKKDIKNKEMLQSLPLTFIIVQGNHEKYAKNIQSYQKIK